MAASNFSVASEINLRKRLQEFLSTEKTLSANCQALAVSIQHTDRTDQKLKMLLINMLHQVAQGYAYWLGALKDLTNAEGELIEGASNSAVLDCLNTSLRAADKNPAFLQYISSLALFGMYFEQFNGIFTKKTQLNNINASLKEQGLSLDAHSILINPVQRFPRFPLLFTDIVRTINNKDNNDNYAAFNLSNAQSILRKFERIGNTLKKFYNLKPNLANKNSNKLLRENQESLVKAFTETVKEDLALSIALPNNQEIQKQTETLCSTVDTITHEIESQIKQFISSPQFPSINDNGDSSEQLDETVNLTAEINTSNQTIIETALRLFAYKNKGGLLQSLDSQFQKEQQLLKNEFKENMKKVYPELDDEEIIDIFDTSCSTANEEEFHFMIDDGGWSVNTGYDEKNFCDQRFRESITAKLNGLNLRRQALSINSVRTPSPATTTIQPEDSVDFDELPHYREGNRLTLSRSNSPDMISQLNQNQELLQHLNFFINDQIIHLETNCQGQKGVLDKRNLYTILSISIQQAIDEPNTNPITVANLINRAATISHHRRHRTSNKMLGILSFGLFTKEANSWIAYKLFVETYKDSYGELNKLSLERSLRVREDKLNCQTPNKPGNCVNKEVRGYEEYRRESMRQ